MSQAYRSTLSSVTPFLGFAAYSGTGKTTLLERLIPNLTAQGLKVAVIKHAHHDFDIDQEGKDSFRLRKAGASQMLINSRYRSALITETPETEQSCQQLLNALDHDNLDLILIEGYKKLSYPKIELHRHEVSKPWIHPEDDNIVAIAANIEADSSLPQLDINNLEQLTDFVLSYLKEYQHQNQSDHKVNNDLLSPAFLSVEQAKSNILDSLTVSSNSVELSLFDAVNHTVACDLLSPINVPQYNNSAMDGYAIVGCNSSHPNYKVVGSVMAGHRFEHTLSPGEAVRIMTGAPVPDNATAVIMREQAEERDNMVQFSLELNEIKTGQNIRLAGEDLAVGEVAIAKGTKISSAELGMIASLGITSVTVNRPIRVAIFSTGDEVQAPGEAQKESSIYDSNRYSLFGLLSHLDCEVIDLGIIEDSEESLQQALLSGAQQADLIISSGGVSVGDADYIKSCLTKLGQINFWRINMRPGRPLAFGTIFSEPTDHTPFFGLPGNPVAVMVAFLQFVEPVIRRLQGQQDWQAEKLVALATENIRSRVGRTEYSRGIYTINHNGHLEVRTTGKQGSGILRSMSEANCLIEVAPDVENVEIGAKVTVIPLVSRL
ncbi:bifunctional molybdopterin-guanine dinucleotide biosynthesis adaptor protein MobB/molybdopterin molybdotransferase MoeA [Aliivibrio kagoshimensis]|uniref:bifunctional molybdopterin-guanine dinucleotide biosynthesis adaptor protein MobB/molybdopterin molybdotransferase MoeA n=1 Tax=Aliivibrio kagoshimensis TaxID=2910230 RepID=UPI003D0B2C83